MSILCTISILLFYFQASIHASSLSLLRRRILHRKARRLYDVRAPARSKEHEGTCLQWSLPTSEQAAKCFSSSMPITQSQIFNHKSVGMTNPSIHVHDDNNIPVAIKTKNEVEWWPQALATHKVWNIKRFRRRLGTGPAIYDAVRDACLDWEFQTKGRGIVPVKGSSLPSEQRAYQRRESRGGYEVVHTGIYGDGDIMCTPLSCRQIGSGRRLATFTEALSFKVRWLPRLFVVNPVMVVYDLVDQRAVGTTYTSTAYATMKGHWLAGEERLTVAHRDGTGNIDLEIVSYSKPASSLIGRLVWPFIGPFQTKFFEAQMDYLEQVARQAAQRQNTQPNIMGKRHFDEYQQCRNRPQRSCYQAIQNENIDNRYNAVP